MDLGLRRVEDGDVAVWVPYVQLPNPDVEDVNVLLDAIPNFVVGVMDDLDLERMLVDCF